jgi:aromatic-L-amino-acid decarboxylase
MISEEFKAMRYRLIDHIANFLDSLPGRPDTPAESPVTIREALQAERPLPKPGKESAFLLDRSATLHLNLSLFNGHPRFWGFIVSSPAPIGALGDLLAYAVNPNVAAWTLSPIASEIEALTIRWIAEMIGDQTDCSGLFVSSGNMANLVYFLAARQAKRGWDARICIIPFLCFCSPRCS